MAKRKNIPIESSTGDEPEQIVLTSSEQPKAKNKKIPSDELYDAGFEFLGCELWNHLSDGDLFAVELSGGGTVFCSVTGSLGEYKSLIIYRNEKELGDYFHVLWSDQFISEEDQLDMILTCSDLRLVIDGLDEFSKKEAKTIRSYLKRKKPDYSVAAGCPHFLSKRQYSIPWETSDPDELNTIYEALKAAVWFSGKVKGKKKDALFANSGFTLPCIRKTEKGYSVFEADLPAFSLDPSYPEPVFENDIMLYRLSGLEKRGNFECEVVFPMAPMQDEETEAPYFPALLLCLDNNTDLIMQNTLHKDYIKEDLDILNEFASGIEELGHLPETIRVDDYRTRSLLRDFCKKTGVKLRRIKQHLRSFKEIKSELFSSVSPDSDEQLDQLSALVNSLDKNSIRQLDNNTLSMLVSVIDLLDIPPEKAKILRSEHSSRKL